MKLQVAELFAGMGGMGHALNLAKVRAEVVFANDIDKFAAKTYRANCGTHIVSEKDREVFREGDIREIPSSEIPHHDILTAGFPCQPFSLTGKNKGFKDEKNGDLFFEVVRVLQDKQPRCFLLENVRGLTFKTHSEAFATMLDVLRECGYEVKWQVLNMATHGNRPQHRERLFIVGFLGRNKIAPNKPFFRFEFPDRIPLEYKPKHFILTKRKVDEKYYYTAAYLETLERIRQRHGSKKGGYGLVILDREGISKTISCSAQGKDRNAVLEEGEIAQIRRTCLRRSQRELSPTLTANMGTGGHNVPVTAVEARVRRLTPRECLQFQGFNKYYELPCSDTQSYKQIGNAVPVTVVSRILQNMTAALNGGEG